MKKIMKILTVAAVILALYVLITPNTQAQPKNGQMAQAFPATVETVKKKDVQLWRKYSGRCEAYEYAEIRPRVGGIITELRFEDGQYVEEGDVLYVIDPRPYEAAVAQAQAELEAAKNESSLTWKELKRAKELIKTNAISKRILDERSANHVIAAANVKAAEARLQRAELDLDFAYIKAPISGVLGRADIRRGNLVDPSADTPLLTTIVTTKPIYVDFEVDEQTYLQSIRGSKADDGKAADIPVKLYLPGSEQAYEGTVDSFDNRIDPSTGTIRARAIFDNEEGTLLPGMFTQVEMGIPSSEKKILLTEQAIATDQDRKYVYVLDQDNKAEYRIVQIGQSIRGERIIESGLEDGERVVTEGLIRIRPGMEIAPKGASSKTQASSQ